MPPNADSTKSPDADRSKSSKIKPNITVDNLKANGIEYDPTILRFHAAGEAQSEDLPPSIDGVRQFLLDFTASSIHEDCKSFMEHQLSESKQTWTLAETATRNSWSLVPPTTAWWNPTFPDAEDEIRRQTIIDDIGQCRKIAEAAGDLQAATEAGWTLFLRNNVFRNFRGTSRPLRKYDHVFEQWCLEEDVYWTNHARTPKNDGHRLTGPKPDLTYGFPIYKSTDDLPKALIDMDIARNFLTDAIRRFNDPPWELKLSLTTRIHHGDSAEFRTSDLMCFPWAVVEVKRRSTDEGLKDFCYQQAANASATALDIMTGLFRTSDGRVTNDLPPIIAFTCNGPELRLWLTFWCNREGRSVKRMACIWATHLELAWGIFATRALVSQMTKWAMRVLKPKICHHLTSIALGSRAPHANYPVPSPDHRHAPPHSPANLAGQTNNPKSTSVITPPRNETAARDISAKAQTPSRAQRPSNIGDTNSPPSTAPKKFSLGDISGHVFSWDKRPSNEKQTAPSSKKKDGPPMSTSSDPRSKAIIVRGPQSRRIVIRLPPSVGPTPRKAQDITDPKLPDGAIFSSSKKSPPGVSRAYVFTSKAWAPSEKDHPSHPLHSKGPTRSVQSFAKGQHPTATQQQPKSNSEDNQPLRQEPEILLGTPRVDAPPIRLGPSTAQRQNSHIPTSDASVEDRDDSEYSGDTSDSEYLPNEQSNNEGGDEIVDGPEGKSWETQDTESGNNSDSEYAGSGHNGVQDSSECGSSEFWGSEDCYPLSDVSGDEVSIEGS